MIELTQAEKEIIAQAIAAADITTPWVEIPEARRRYYVALAIAAEAAVDRVLAARTAGTWPEACPVCGREQASLPCPDSGHVASTKVRRLICDRRILRVQVSKELGGPYIWRAAVKLDPGEGYFRGHGFTQAEAEEIAAKHAGVL